MGTWDNKSGVELLIDRPVPDLVEFQIDKFSKDSMHSQFIFDFNAGEVMRILRSKEGSNVLGADFGGDKGIVRLFKVQDGLLKTIDGYRDDIQGDDGRGYLQTIERAGAFASSNNIPFGLTWGGPMDGSKVLFHPKAKQFIGELNDHYGGDLKNISPSIKACLNDGPDGLVRGAVEAYKKFNSKNVLFVINGGGIALATLVDGMIYSNEAGHVEAVQELNKYDQDTPCGVFGAKYVCLERLGANKAGIETQWQHKTGEYLRARDIEDCYKAGNEFAGELYDHSAFVIAHMINGGMKAYNMSLNDPSLTIVFHGGAFKFPYYGERVVQVLAKDQDVKVKMIMTKDFGAQDSNACLEGASIMALLA